MENTHASRLLKSAKSLRTSLLVVITQVDDLCDLIEKAVSTPHEAPPVEAGSSRQKLRVERSTYSVSWGQHRCVLGHTMAFHIMQRIARQPDEYISMDQLLDDLWIGPRSYSTVRSTICRLKAKLRESGMADLAGFIDGTMHGHYGLILRQA